MAPRLTPYARLERAVRPLVQRGELDRAIARCEAELSALPRTDYHAALGRSWLRQSEDLAGRLAEFYRNAAKTISVRALYCELNRFEINTDAWYLDAFAYDFWGDPKELDWLVGWKANSPSRFTLEGAADLQALFARDYTSEPPESVRAASEIVILLLTLRMQELVVAAARSARQAGSLPEDVPVLAAAHDSDLICLSYGSVKPRVTRKEPARPAAVSSAKRDVLAVYAIAGGYDEFHNSLPWDVLNYADAEGYQKYGDPMRKAAPLAATWEPPLVSLRKRKWRCDLISLYPQWAVNEKARAALAPLLEGTVEFLPLRSDKLPPLWVLHPLRHVDLSPAAEHNARPGDNMTVVRRFSFEPEALVGNHYFGVSQAPGSHARKAGFCFTGTYVSEEFKHVVATQELKGIVFEEVFSLRASQKSEG